MVKICLDAGHYGKYNRSPANKNYYESLRMWDLHLLLKKYLEEYECIVINTRTDQTKDLALYKRGAMAAGCAVFLSLHSNAVAKGVNENVDYVVIYHLMDDKGTNVDDISKELAKELASTIADVMETKQGGRTNTRKASSDKNKDGVLNDNYYGVLNGARQANVPGMIIEHSFHTNTRSTNWLLDDANLDKLARAEAKTIAEYFGLKKKEIAPAQMYRVQTGAYSNRDNADARYKAVKNAGFDVCMVKSGGLYKVQVGAYKIKENAEKQLEIIEKAGFDACITTKSGEAVTVEEYTLEEFIRDVQCATGSEVTGKANQETLENTITVSACVNYEDAVVAPIQRRLNALGYDCGEPDGKAGSKFTKAVEKLQKDIGAFVDGEITRMNKTWRFLLGML